MKKLITVILCFAYLFTEAQMIDVKEKPSGYLGKRFLVGINGSFSASSDLQQASTTNQDYHITLNKEFYLSLHYTYSSDKSIGLVTGLSHTSFNADGKFDANYDISNGITILDNQGQMHELMNIFGTPDIKDAILGAEVRLFRSRKGAFSPIGQYFSYGLIVHSYTIDMSQMTFDVISDVGFGNKERNLLKNVAPAPVKVLPELNVGAGFSKPIVNGLFFDAGIKFGWLMSVKTLYAAAGVSGSSGETNFASLMENYIVERVRNREIINFNLGLSYPF